MAENKSQIYRILQIILISIVFGCTLKNNQNDSILKKDNPFQKHIDSVAISNDAVAGIILHIECPDLNISWTGSAGSDKNDTFPNLKFDQPFRIASITKTYVATAILLLSEKNKINIDDSIGVYLSKESIEKLKRGGYQTDRISVKNLLNHTNGIFDYAMSDYYFNKINMNPNYLWSRTEQLEIAIKYGRPQSEPNEQFYYSDTGYILLGEIIESITGESLAESLRDLIGFKRLGLNSTWTESIEPKPKGLQDIVHPYYNGKDFYAINPSIDLYGGGGLVSTAPDLAIFFQTLFTNGILKKHSTLETMLVKTEFSNEQQAAQDYRLGIQVAEIYGFKIYYHTGIWGALAAYIPELNSTVVVNFTTGYDPEILMESVLILDKLKNN